LIMAAGKAPRALRYTEALLYSEKLRK
jgi:hypothetical protein